MSMIEKVYEKARQYPRRIVFPEGDEKRTLLAAEKLKKAGICIPILLGKQEAIRRSLQRVLYITLRECLEQRKDRLINSWYCLDREIPRLRTGKNNMSYRPTVERRIIWIQKG